MKQMVLLAAIDTGPSLKQLSVGHLQSASPQRALWYAMQAASEAPVHPGVNGPCHALPTHAMSLQHGAARSGPAEHKRHQ
jgi:hypothetical protein